MAAGARPSAQGALPRRDRSMNPSSSSNSLMTVTWIVVAFVLLVLGAA